MKNLPTFTPSNLSFFICPAPNLSLIIFTLIVWIFSQETTYAQSYFSPNPKVVVDYKKIDAFIKATPEIALKAEYYNVSNPVLETILVLQSNAGATKPDGLYNYSRVIPNPQLTGYPAFSKAKNGFILCTTRSRGVEATALSLSLLRNDGKKSLTDGQWLTLVFGPDGDLSSLAPRADEIYTGRTGKSFNELGVNFGSGQMVSGNEKTDKVEKPAPEEQVRTSQKEKEIPAGTSKSPKTQNKSEFPPSEPATNDMSNPKPTSESEIAKNKMSNPNEELSDPKPTTTITQPENVKPKEETKPVTDPQAKVQVNTQDTQKPTEKAEAEDPKSSNGNKDSNPKASNPNLTDDPKPVSNTIIKNSAPEPQLAASSAERKTYYATEQYKPKYGKPSFSIYGGIKYFDMPKETRELTLRYVDESPSRDNLNSTTTVEGNQAYHLGLRYQGNSEDNNLHFLIDGQGYFGSISGLSLALGCVNRINNKAKFVIQPEISAIFGYGAKGIGTIQNNDRYIQVNDTKFQDYTNVKVAVENYFVGIKPGLSFSIRTGYKSEIGIGVSYQLSFKTGSVTFSGKDDSEKSASASEKLTEPNVDFFVNGIQTEKVPFNPDGLEFKLYYSW